MAIYEKEKKKVHKTLHTYIKVNIEQH